MLPMPVLLAVVIVIVVCLVLAFLDRSVKAIRRGHRRREANERLAAAAAVAEARDRERRAAAQAQEALTSIMPTIHDHDARHVE
jgi:uncharacterized membrane protein